MARFFLVWAMWLGTSSLYAEARTPAVVQGLLDLRDTDLTGPLTVELSGDWEFYWDEHITGQEAQRRITKTYRRIPLPWSESKAGEPKYPAFGRASYRLKILLPENHPQLLLRIPEIFTAYNVLIDDRVQETYSFAGYDGASSRATRRTSYIGLDSQSKSLDLVLQISNYVSGTGGVWRSLQLSNTTAMMELRARQQFQTLFTVYALGVMSVYHFVLFMFRRESKENLWFALFCLMVFVRSFFVGNDLLIYNLVDSFDWTWSRRLEFVTFYLVASFGARFSAEMYPNENNKYFIRSYQILAFSVSLFVILAPHVLFRKTLLPMQIITAFGALYALSATFLAVMHRRPQSRIMIFGFALTVFGMLHDILNSIFRFNQLEITSIGVVGGVLTTSLVISKRFSQAFDRLAFAENKIRLQNEHLDLLVRKKTEDIRVILANIPQAIFAFDRGGRLHPEYSESLFGLFTPEQHKPFENVIEEIFQVSNLSGDQIYQMKSAISFSIGEILLNYQFNVSMFPLSFEKRKGLDLRYYEVDWHPIVTDDSVVDRILICIRDTTELKILKEESLKHDKSIVLVSEFLRSDLVKIRRFLKNLDEGCQQLRRSLSEDHGNEDSYRKEFLRFLHTQKGNARTLGLITIASSIHETEEKILLVKSSNGLLSFDNLLLELTDELSFFLQTFKSLQFKTIELDSPLEQWAEDLLKEMPSYSDSSSVSALNKTLQQLHRRLLEKARISLADCIDQGLSQLPSLSTQLGKPHPHFVRETLGIEKSLFLTHDGEARLRGALNHIFANMLDHGIEDPATRRLAGKSEQGLISIELRRSEASWILDLQDDGRGLPMEAIVRKAHEMAIEVPETAEGMAAMLLINGFSTKKITTEISGRGVGLDAVNAEIQGLGGQFQLLTKARGEGIQPLLIFRIVLSDHWLQCAKTLIPIIDEELPIKDAG